MTNTKEAPRSWLCLRCGASVKPDRHTCPLCGRGTRDTAPSTSPARVPTSTRGDQARA